MQIETLQRTASLALKRVLLTACLMAGICGELLAAEPVLEFLEGLRGRRYFDTALFYLEQLEADQGLPPDIKAILPYERGQTLLQSAKELSNLDAQRQQLEMAQAAFEQFVKANPGHLLAGRANTARGQILLEKARVDIWDGDKPSNEGNRENFRVAARKGIAAARNIFAEARAQHEANWKKYPAFIPEDQPAERAARGEAEELFIRAQLDLAQCTYWEAQTYDKASKERIALLKKAAAEFESIHQQYRSQLGGLFARIWQGKCFEEQGNEEGIRIALGIYGEILEHDGTTATMRNLKDRARRFRLICLNYPERHDYQLVIQEAEEWLKEARDRARTDVGMGIQWELCRAQEALGMDRTASEATRKAMLTQALNRARAINRYPGELKTPSSAMIQRLMVALNRDPSDPKDFDTAYGNGGQLYDQLSAANASIRKLQSEGKQQEALEQHQALVATAGEMSRMYDLALKLVTPANDPTMVNIARLRLSYGYLLQQRYFDAAVVADDLMSRYGEKFPEVAREAGFLAMTAFDNAYANAPEADRQFETEQVIAAANKICDRWPDSDRANDARNTVAKIYWNAGDLLTAAQWWEKIPVGTAQYGDAQVRAGKAYWRQYVLATARPAEEEQAKPEELNQWKQQAIEHLTIGLEDAEKNTPADRPLSDDLVGAKLTLVNIRNLDGIYQTQGDGPRGALDLLTKDPHPVLKAVDVPKGEARPKDPGRAKSRQMASFAYQQLLRAWVGLKNLDEARKARVALEEVAGGEDEAALTQVFVDFGRELEQELARLKAAGETKRLDDVRAGFESFLNDLFQRKDGQTFYSLLWVAETYTSLADGSADNPAKAKEFYSRAATAYRSIISSAAADPKFANAQQLLACKLRLVNCLREQKNFAEAETVLVEVLKANPNAPDAQFQAAELYEAWAASGAEEDKEKYKIALYGKKDPVHIWGWTYASQSLQQAVYNQPGGRLEQMLFDARYRLADAERKYGLSLTDPKESNQHLVRARSSITGFQRVSKRWTDEEYLRFNSLYKQTLADLGDPVANLPRQLTAAEKEEPVAVAETAKPEQSASQAAPSAAVPPAPLPAAPPKSNTMTIITLLLIAIVGAAVVYFTVMKPGGRKKKVSSRTADEDLPPPGLSGTPGKAVPAAVSGDNFFGPPVKSGTAKPRPKSSAPAIAFPSFGDAPVSGPKPAAAKPAAAKPAAAKPAVTKPASASPAAGGAAAPRPATANSAGQKGTPAGPRPVAGVKPPSTGATLPPAKPRPASPSGGPAPGSVPPRPAAPRPPASDRPPAAAPPRPPRPNPPAEN